jgi:succinate dehydrogenase / fumarate reductase flavoprotein subunit
LEGVLEIYEKFMREDPIETPMRIYPAVHYTMGGLWVDYALNPDGSWNVDEPRNQMTNIPGLYAAGECEYQYHGANRLGANALLTCLVGGEITAQGVSAYLQQSDRGTGVEEAIRDAKALRTTEYAMLKSSNGIENPYRLHAELADVMWNNCGIWRVQKDLLSAREKLDELAARARQCDLIDDSGWNNQAVPFTRTVINMIESSKAIVGGAIVRDESRGAHFKMNTPARDDEHWLKTTLATYSPEGPSFDFEPIDIRLLKPKARKYAVNQLMIVKKLMGEDALGGFETATASAKV